PAAHDADGGGDRQIPYVARGSGVPPGLLPRRLRARARRDRAAPRPPVGLRARRRRPRGVAAPPWTAVPARGVADPDGHVSGCMCPKTGRVRTRELSHPHGLNLTRIPLAHSVEG